MTAPSPWDDEFFGDKEEYDAFFDQDGRGAPPTGASSSSDFVVPRALGSSASSSKEAEGKEASATKAIESEYELFGEPGSAEAAGKTSPGQNTVTFSLDDDDDEVDVDMVQSDYKQDCRVPELPEPPEDFSAEDLRLREVLTNFYFRNRADNLANVHLIIQRYRGRALSHLWAQLAAKYAVTVPDVLELLAGSMYVSSPFEYADGHCFKGLEEKFADVLNAALDTPEDRAALLRKATEDGACNAVTNALRMLCFRGLPRGSELRPQVWRILLGCLPVNQPGTWDAIQSEMRTLYARCKADVLVVSNELKLEIKVEGGRLMEAMHLLQQIQKDVDRTQQGVEHFRMPATRVALISFLFVYANQNPDVGYVQGMNEVAAVAFHVMSADPEFEEADAFWCFSYLMKELKAGFLQGLDPSADTPSEGVAVLERLLKTYDPELHRHLQRCGCPTRPFTFRWCTLLFAQDVPLSDVVRLWDSFIGDPQRYEFASHVCLATLVLSREELLRHEDTGELAEVIRRAPRLADFDSLLRRAWAICAFERRSPTPPFPAKSTKQVVQELSGWARTAAAKAQELSAGVAQTVQQKVAPGVKDKVGQASGVSGVITQGSMEMARGSVQALKAWLEQDAPMQPETALKAQEKAASMWEASRKAGVPELAQGGVRAAQGGVQAVKAWYAQDAPIQPETAAKAQETAASIWQAVRGRGASAMSKDQKLATDASTAAAVETVDTGSTASAAASSSGAAEASSATLAPAAQKESPDHGQDAATS